MRENKLGLLLLTLIITQQSLAQNAATGNKLPVNMVPVAAHDTSKPMVLYITGDGGWNKFSRNLAIALAGNGYPVASLNANEYFWKKKTPAQTAADITLLIKTCQLNWNRKKIILLGYSFGADVMPFVYNLLPADLNTQVTNICLLSVSTHTDFEIHLMAMLGAGFNKGESVVAEINKINNKPVTLIFGEGENSFPLNQLKIKNYTQITLDGGHHYNENEALLSNTIIQNILKK